MLRNMHACSQATVIQDTRETRRQVNQDKTRPSHPIPGNTRNLLCVSIWRQCRPAQDLCTQDPINNPLGLQTW